ncbi:MAG: ATP-dependent sacrificial sulfur transferase LarE [Deltaproteobacteria bacterium]|nr:ATP-dependent sacrificial sulfur transferase LarE [Deltaproteobacteria bacterium]
MAHATPHIHDATALAHRLEDACRALESAVVAYSGGVDSAVVLAAAHRVLGQRMVGLMALSPSFPSWELADAQAQAGAVGAELVVARTDELSNPRYAANTGDRCYFCKSALFDACERARTERGFRAIAYGANLDDLGDDRPGHLAARERGIASPLIDAGLNKAAVRRVAAHYGLSSADKPALACLSSRFPTGTPIDAERLARVGQAERVLVDLGFRRVRVRFHDELARIEVDPEDLPRLLQPATRALAVAGVRAAGFRHVTVDLEGYRMGGANRLTVLS